VKISEGNQEERELACVQKLYRLYRVLSESVGYF